MLYILFCISFRNRAQQLFDVYRFYRDAWHFLRLQTERDSSTDNLKYMDRIETQGGCVTGNERVDLKRKSGLATEKMNWNERTDMTRKEPEKNRRWWTPKKETTGETWSESKALKRKRMIWQEKGWLGANNRVKMQEKIVRRWCRNIASVRYINSTNSFQYDLKNSTGMKKTIFWYRKYTTWSSCALAQQCYWKFPCTGTHAWCHDTCSSCAVTHILDATRTPCCAAWSSDAHMHWYTWCYGN